MEGYGVRFSQVDAAYPLSGKDGPVIGLPYVLKSIPWAAHAGCNHVATTDGLHAPEGLADAQAMDMMKRSYEQIITVAEAYDVIVTIEVHGYFTTNPDNVEKMLAFVDSPNLRMNLDTGNTFIAGQDPVAFCRRFLDKISHVHVKDVSESLADSMRGKDTGIAISHVRDRRRRECREHQAVPGHASRSRLHRRAEHGVRRPGRTVDREVVGVVARDAGGIEYPR